MPGRPSPTSEIESPTGCTKQLISVACIGIPAADLLVGERSDGDAGFQRFFCGHGSDFLEGVSFIGYAFERELAIRLRCKLQPIDIYSRLSTTHCGNRGSGDLA